MNAEADFQALTRESPFPRVTWACEFGFTRLPDTLEKWQQEYGLDLSPDFQRGHVWTDEQRSAFIEYVLSGGPSGRDLYFSAQGWQTLTQKTAIQIVDGKQRLEAVLRFVTDRLRVRGKLRSEWTGVIRLEVGGSFRFHIAECSRPDALRWYLALNSAGTPHTPEEIERVRALLAAELAGA